MLFSVRADVRKELERLLVREDLGDPAWPLTLDEDDEPPLFLRFSDAEFLRVLPPLERALSVIDFAAGQLDRIRSATSGALVDAVHDLFVCLTFHWWGDVASGEAATVCPRFLVVPRYSKVCDQSVPFLAPQTANGNQVARWLETIHRQDLLAAEIVPDEIGRVYVGYRGPSATGFKSIGDFVEN